jgi:hypothetical protein
VSSAGARLRVINQLCRTEKAHGSDEDDAHTNHDEGNAVVSSKGLCQAVDPLRADGTGEQIAPTSV